MDDDHFNEISVKLDRIIKLLSLSAIRDLKEEDQILTLSSIGFQPAEIAGLLGKTPNAVRISLHRTRKKALKTAEVPAPLDRSLQPE